MAAVRILALDDIASAATEAAGVLRGGGVVVFPTETVYGIGVAAGNERAVEKLHRLKQRPEGKPFQLLVADIESAERIGAVFSARARRLAVEFWPGPLTLVAPDGTGSGTLGIRVPDSPFVLALCAELGRAVMASSANVAGEPFPLNAADADVFGLGVDLLVDGGPIVEGVPSTVARCIGGELEILRVGGISEGVLRSAWVG